MTHVVGVHPYCMCGLAAVPPFPSEIQLTRRESQGTVNAGESLCLARQAKQNGANNVAQEVICSSCSRAAGPGFGVGVGLGCFFEVIVLTALVFVASAHSHASLHAHTHAGMVPSAVGMSWLRGSSSSSAFDNIKEA